MTSRWRVRDVCLGESDTMSGEIRPAATVIVARPGPRGIEVLVLRRTPRHRFLPGYLVFPGGAVDEEDRVLAAAWFGDASEAWRACGIRELAEEVGLALTAEGLVVADVSRVASAPPPLDVLPQVSHWVAPEDVPVRFDARYFAVAAPRGIEPDPDGVEAERAWWARPVDLVVAHESGGANLYWPTLKVMEGLAACETVEAVLGSTFPALEPQVQTV